MDLLTHLTENQESKIKWAHVRLDFTRLSPRQHIVVLIINLTMFTG